MYIYTADDDRLFAAQTAAREAMREREDELEALKKEIEQLKTEISRLKKDINALGGYIPR